MLDVSAAAWAVLLPAWGMRWVLIIGLGSVPFVTRKAFLLFAKPLPARFSVFKQTCAFAAMLVCIWSFQLAADTYLVENGDFSKLDSRVCTVHARQALTVDLACDGGGTFHGVASSAVAAPQDKLYLLPRSNLPVYFGP